LYVFRDLARVEGVEHAVSLPAAADRHESPSAGVATCQLVVLETRKALTPENPVASLQPAPSAQETVHPVVCPKCHHSFSVSLKHVLGKIAHPFRKDETQTPAVK
jgi:hypothetical protein